MKKLISMFGMFLLCAACVAAQSQAAVKNSNVKTDAPQNSLEEILIAKEKQKWDALASGRWSEMKDLFAEDFVSIGYQPDGSVKLTTKADSFAATGALPAGISFTLGDFKVIRADKKNAVVTYTASGPIKVQASSHWTRRGKIWQTVFYQATMLR